MSALWTRDTAMAATGGNCVRDWQATGVSIDTRTLMPGDLFVALRAARDGHDFAAKAFERGAAAALVARRPPGVPLDAPMLVVSDVLDALGALARAARARFRGQVLAVTGSVGKTGAKEMLRLALGAQGSVHAAEKSYNNHWGVPLTLARLAPDRDFSVLEIGMNAPGEIAPLARLVRPHVGLITTVAPVHMAAFRDIRAIAREKASIVEGIEPKGSIVLNRDIPTYPTLLRAARRAGVRPVRFGAFGRPEFRLRDVQVGATGTSVSAMAGGREFLFRLGAQGRHLAMNGLGVLAAVDALGGDLARAALALADWRAPEGRGARWTVDLGPGGLDGGIVLIDESYNANPAALAAALETFALERPVDGVGRVRRGRRIAFLADMLELGARERDLHAEIACIPALRDVSTVHCAGPLMKALHEALQPDQRGEWFETAEDMAGQVRRLLDAGDVAIVKGSNGSRAVAVANAIRRMGAARPATGVEG